MKVTGVDKLLKQIAQLGKEGKLQSEKAVEGAADDIAVIAKLNAPANNGNIRKFIKSEAVNKLNFEVVSYAPYSGYVEFGTGAKVYVPKEMQEMANSIRNQKGGDRGDALESIQDWCRDKGIDERAAWPILMSILDEGLRPRPFLYPAFVQGSAKFVKNLNSIFNELSKKFNAAK